MDFREQIQEDIRYYQESSPYIEKMKKDEWAFNFWVLDKLFCEDEDVLMSHIIDYSDNGIDCYVWHEEEKDLYLIQNKYYNDDSTFTSSYFNNAVEDGYQQLCNNTYHHSPDLQAIFSKNSGDEDFYVYHYFYVTNDKESDSVKEAVANFNESHGANRQAQVFYLSDIERAFYGNPKTPDKHLTVALKTMNKGTTLIVNNDAYELGLGIDATYMMLPVIELYKALEKADEKKYPIFDANIREYLGTGRSVNKGIINTLKNKSDRNNFFFYNNGITIICTGTKSSTEPDGRVVKLDDPQIVNGCQTVSSIRQVLASMPPSSLKEEFKNTYVMAKILVIPTNTKDKDTQERLKKLKNDIVKFNNSQNSIDEKSFEANTFVFQRIQREFGKYGFLVLLKQSDKNKFTQQYKQPSELRERAASKLELFGLTESVKKVQDFTVPLEKLLQVVLAFYGDAQQAFQKKGNLLKRDSKQYQTVVEAIRSPELTTRRLLDLYLLYLRSEAEKKASAGKAPITWYFIEGFSHDECNGGDCTKIDEYTNSPENIDKLISLYTGTTEGYLEQYTEDHPDKGYNEMIKEKLDFEEFEKCKRMCERMAQRMYKRME